MSKSNKCSLKDDTCDDLINGTRIVTDKVKIPKTNLDMNLVGKELCRHHYNKLIVNENRQLTRAVKKQQCAHPKHEEYTKDNEGKRGRPRKNVLVKIPKRLQLILDLPLDALICNPCLTMMDHDEENQQSSNYQPPTQRVPTNDSDNPYVLRNHILYSAKEYNELEILYHEAREELEQIKLTSISSEKIRLLSNVLYKKQHKDGERPIYDPDKFKKMLEEEEPKLQGFFDEFVAGTNFQQKNSTTNQRNKKKLVIMCYLLAGFNNKFINDVKEDIGFLLDTSGTSTSAIESMANAGLTVRKETIQKQKIRLANSHQQTVKDYIIDNVFILF
ncbi:unnamed protein product [Rhizophagus irregularis]|nr:unnamed protein product [Rhizophagus irregularis]